MYYVVCNSYNDQLIIYFVFSVVIVDEYQEQPHLLDPHLEEIITLIINKAQNPDCEEGNRQLLFTCLYLLTKVPILNISDENENAYGPYMPISKNHIATTCCHTADESSKSMVVTRCHVVYGCWLIYNLTGCFTM